MSDYEYVTTQAEEVQEKITNTSYVDVTNYLGNRIVKEEDTRANLDIFLQEEEDTSEDDYMDDLFAEDE